jgi:hypothetical protein
VLLIVLTFAASALALPVSPRVGNVKNNDPTLIEPIAA